MTYLHKKINLDKYGVIMGNIVILIIIVGTAIGALTFFLIRVVLHPRAMEGLAALFKHGKNQQVIKRAKQFLVKDSRNVDAHYFLGRAYLAEDKPELALMEFKIINQLGQFTTLCREVPFRKQAAELFHKFNQDDEALKEYLLLIKKEPGKEDYYYNAGSLFEARNMSDKAFLYYRKSIELNKEHPGAHQGLGILLSKQKKPLEAKAELEIALKYDPENYKTHYYMGRLLKEMYDYSGALRSFEKAQRDPEIKVKALIESGTSYMSMNNLDRAISTLERAENLIAGNSTIEILYCRYCLSLCYERKRDLDKAIQHWEYIYSIKPTFRDVAKKLSQYQELRTDDSMKDYMTSANEGFLEICKGIIRTLKFEVRDTKAIKNGCQITAVEAEKNWKTPRRMPCLFMFLRVTDAIDEYTVRNFLEEMKKSRILRGIILTSSKFTPKAVRYADTRPVDLVQNDKLSSILKKVKG